MTLVSDSDRSFNNCRVPHLNVAKIARLQTSPLFSDVRVGILNFFENHAPDEQFEGGFDEEQRTTCLVSDAPHFPIRWVGIAMLARRTR
jgi:hypothetical protein